jgi:hypothetical protein
MLTGAGNLGNKRPLAVSGHPAFKSEHAFMHHCSLPVSGSLEPGDKHQNSCCNVVVVVLNPVYLAQRMHAVSRCCVTRMLTVDDTQFF